MAITLAISFFGVIERGNIEDNKLLNKLY